MKYLSELLDLLCEHPELALSSSVSDDDENYTVCVCLCVTNSPYIATDPLVRILVVHS